jgi:hypothetical protein
MATTQTARPRSRRPSSASANAGLARNPVLTRRSPLNTTPLEAIRRAQWPTFATAHPPHAKQRSLPAPDRWRHSRSTKQQRGGKVLAQRRRITWPKTAGHYDAVSDRYFLDDPNGKEFYEKPGEPCNCVGTPKLDGQTWWCPVDRKCNTGNDLKTTFWTGEPYRWSNASTVFSGVPLGFHLGDKNYKYVPPEIIKGAFGDVVVRERFVRVK